MKIVIVMTSYRRADLLQQTLKSLEQYKGRDVHIIVDEDECPGKTWVNSCIAYNRGFHLALEMDPDIVIIQNAECYHGGDIVGYAEKHLTSGNYISFGCYSISRESPLPPLIMWNEGASFDGQSAWYNHPEYRPVGYHFCSAITAENLRKLNGFDERFKDGKDYEDNYLLHQISRLGLRIEITSEPFVFHQWHYSAPRAGGSNKELYESLVKTEGYRAVHLITPDL